MNFWMNSLAVLADEWQLITVILFFIFIGQRLIRSILQPIFGDGLTTSELISLGIGGWIVPAMFISLTWTLWGKDHAIPFGLLALVVILFSLPRLKWDPAPASVSTSLIFALFVFLSILLRLTYVSQALFPLYFDSSQHYLVIKNILGNDGSWIFNWLSVTYYHLGFHFLTAFLASISQVEIARVMLVFGQVILALLPFPFFFLVRHVAKSDMAGWFAVILSSFGWYMPAHAVDWGKYPALMSLGMIPFVLGLASFLPQNKSANRQWALYILLGSGILFTVFTHSRSLIVLGILSLAWIAGTWWQKLPQRQKTFVFFLVVVITLVEVVFIQRQSILALLFDPYLQKGILITAIVLLFSIFAWLTYPRLTFVSVSTMTLLLAGLFVPVTWIPGYRDLTLLDRPFVEMILFMPLSILGGLGLAGLEKRLQGRFAWSRYAGLLAIGIVVVNAFFTYDLYPSGCCVIVGNDDVLAMDWMADQLPVNARIGISSTQLKVMPSEASEGDVGADAGIWITPLTGRVTISLPYDSGFDQRSTLERLCELEIDYLFVGEIGQPFDVNKMTPRPEWYRPLLSMPKTRVYEVIGCN